MDYLFVYGTLRRGFPLKLNDEISKGLKHLGKAKVNGVLYDLGNYPGAVESADNEIVGDLFILLDSDVLVQLDEYEGEEYQRRRTKVRLRSGNELKAWMYWYGRIPDEKQKIRYKDYFNYLKYKKSALINGAL